MKQLKELLDISRSFGNDKDFIVAGGGNTSYKDDDTLWVKASGVSLGEIDEAGFVSLSRGKLSVINTRDYGDAGPRRDEQVKNDMLAAVEGDSSLRPSVETSMHNVIKHRFIVHTHPWLVNSLMCSKDSAELTAGIFGDEAVFIEYTDPGYALFKKVRDRIADYAELQGREPHIIFLQNHGVFVSADTTEEIESIYAGIVSKLSDRIKAMPPVRSYLETDSELISSLRQYLAEQGRESGAWTGPLIEHFTRDRESWELCAIPFTPDHIVYCKSKYIFVSSGTSVENAKKQIETFREENGYCPRVIALEGEGLIISEENLKSVQIVLDSFSDNMSIAFGSAGFAGANPMSLEQIDFIDSWEAENYRRKMSKE